MEVANIIEKTEPNKIYGLMGNINLTTNNSNIGIVKGGMFSNTTEEFLNSSKSLNALKLVMLDDSILNKKGTELSNGEIKAVSLAKELIANREIIVLDYFEKELNNREKENYKRLLKKLSKDFNKTIIIYTNDLTFLWDLCEEIMYVDNDNVINTYQKNDYFKLVELVDKPIISNFIEKIRAKGIKIEDYKDIKDLLKAIYRIKEKEYNNEISN
jgi:ABC-type transporter Mla maintaining outer membrane lipid asymmetry ATPase subunit MlaF